MKPPKRNVIMPDEVPKYPTIDDVWSDKNALDQSPVPILGLKNTFVTIDGKHYKLVDLLRKLVTDQVPIESASA
jgi:hypothetical protein